MTDNRYSYTLTTADIVHDHDYCSVSSDSVELAVFNVTDNQ